MTKSFWIAALLALPLLSLPMLSSAWAIEPLIAVSAETVANPRQPQVAVTESGEILIAFGANENVFVCKSTDHGQSFSAPTLVGRVPKLALGRRRGPRISAADDLVVVTAISHERGDVLSWRSTDGAKSWGKSTTVNDKSKSAREGLHEMASGRDGLLFCTWLDLRNGRTQIYGSRSVDRGKTWEENVHIYSSPSGTVCECCHPSVAINASGHICVMWRNSLEGNRDMYLATSEDRGKTFGSAQKLGIGSWTLNACPMDGGDLAVGPNGSWHSVWRRDRQIYSANSDSRREIPLGEGQQPSVARVATSTYLAWVTRPGGALILLDIDSSNRSTIAENASDPVLASSTTGEGTVVAVWESGNGPDASIMFAVIGK